ncbi:MULTISPECIES: mycofactocin biosynthesis peptidyl-dipeptidase MftE [Micrococcaceae]|uniref:mycofactocin biosynthesis peptidyl-dipeptidase MftE n=2 Tax=Micrococcales TaxID=85006 RepID=UPI0017C25FE6|nr:mycofactocin biosynthesis peptidyl-dipeptidase MftE [Citricoccus sp.]MBB5750782.1 creatinine amidohydrolase [Micrococcus sp. TA1]HRO30309.1 mycofactocin biosynthesis peptidyl-dipeptidase MftE [Citricoccus sp.]HRO93316.1 mycofactocin biosynthesis peptidyl-dipeptidase MftE [Citricoccus sp.]
MTTPSARAMPSTATPTGAVGLEARTSAESGGSPMLLVPLGSVEQHGPHLPLGTDNVIAGEVCRRVAPRLGPDWVLGPLIPFGCSGEHEGFAGTVSIGRAQLVGYLVELVRSATRWTRGVRFVTGHGGNVPSLIEACGLLASEGRDAAWTGMELAGADAHAGHTETSLMLRLRPGQVHHRARERGRTDPVGDLMPRLREHGVAAVSPNGVLGDPTTATAAAGDDLFDRLCSTVQERLVQGRVGQGGRLVR